MVSSQLQEASRTLSSQLQKVQQQRDQITQAEENLKRQQVQVQRVQAPGLTLQRQIQLKRSKQLREFRRQGGQAGLKARTESQKREALGQISSKQQEVQQAETQLKSIESKILAQKSQVDKEIQRQRDFALARKFFSKGLPASALGSKQQKEFFRQIREGREQAVKKAQEDVASQLKSNKFIEVSDTEVEKLQEKIAMTQGDPIKLRQVLKNVEIEVTPSKQGEIFQAIDLGKEVDFSKTKRVPVVGLAGVGVSPKREVTEITVPPAILQKEIPIQQQPINVVTAFESPTGAFEKQSFELSRSISQTRTDLLRGKGDQLPGGKAGARLGLVSASFIKQFVDVGVGLKQSPALVSALATQPISTTKQIGVSVKTGLEQFGRESKFQPEVATGKLLFEATALKGGQFVIGGVTKGVSLTRTRLSPIFRPVEKVKITRTTFSDSLEPISRTVETKRFIDVPGESGVTRLEILKPRNFTPQNIFQRSLGEAREVKPLTLSEQASFAGQEGLTVATAQRDIFSVFRKELEINKPLPSPDSPELESSFFVSPPDPSGRPQLRISRLGLSDPASPSFLDVVSEDLTFRRSRSQGLIFESLDVESVPTKLKPLLERAKAGDVSSRLKFEQEFLKFQLKPTGKAKPIGFSGTREPEFTIAPKEIIKATDKPAVTIIGDKRVEIFRAELVNDPKIRSLLEKPDLTSSDLRKVSKATGLDLSSTFRQNTFISPTGLGISQIRSREIKVDTRASLPISRSPRLERTLTPSLQVRVPTDSRSFRSTPELRRSPNIVRTPTLERNFDSPTRGPTITRILRPPTSPPVLRPPAKPPFRPTTPILPKGRSQRSRTRQSGFVVEVKRKGKFQRILGSPTTRERALSKGAEAVLGDLSATFRIRQEGQVLGDTRGGNFGTLRPRFREFTFRKGQRVFTPNVFIQRRSFAGGRLSTSEEVRKIQAAKLVSRRKKRKKKGVLEII